MPPIRHIMVATDFSHDAHRAVTVAWSDEHAPDLIVLGTHGRRGVRRLVLGSVAEQVLRAARCPIVTVRDQEQAAAWSTG